MRCESEEQRDGIAVAAVFLRLGLTGLVLRMKHFGLAAEREHCGYEHQGA